MNYNEFNTKTQNAASQSSLQPSQAIDLLKKGNERFLSNSPVTRNLSQQISDTSKGQYPFAVVLSCIDSRVPTETIFDQGIGDIFNAKVAGNFVNDDILGSMEFACKLAGTKVIVVMGHTSCGAVKGACDNAELGNLTQMLGKIKPAVDGVTTPEGTDRSSKNIDFVNSVAEKNVELTINNIRSNSPVLKELEDAGKIQIVGAMYDVGSGTVSWN